MTPSFQNKTFFYSDAPQEGRIAIEYESGNRYFQNIQLVSGFFHPALRTPTYHHHRVSHQLTTLVTSP
jgi:hypothetical protein